MTDSGCKSLQEERVIISADSSAAQEVIIPSEGGGKTKTHVRSHRQDVVTSMHSMVFSPAIGSDPMCGGAGCD